jgi:FMN phosphatase YigB (HAD superfamily)
MQNIRYILFDASNTLIHKPRLWPAIQSVLTKYGYSIQEEKLKLHHKLLSEVIEFPDRTSEAFYKYFNSELLMSFGIVPNEELLNQFFSACSYLPWERFNDTNWLDTCKLPIGVLSNFHNNLPDILNKLFGNIFSNIIVSETLEIRKPDMAFYQNALSQIGLQAREILYVGDSMKLDILPSKNIAFETYLIDRFDIYAEFKNRFLSLQEVNSII